MKLISILWLWGCLLIAIAMAYKHGINSDFVVGALLGAAMAITLLCTQLFIKGDK